MKKLLLPIVSFLVLGSITGCSSKKKFYNKDLSDEDIITLTIAYPSREYFALQRVAEDFEKLHQNVSISIYSIDSRYDSSLIHAIEDADKHLDMFATTLINNYKNSTLKDYVEDLYQRDDFLIDKTYLPVTHSFSSDNKLYVVPTRVEFSGTFVNETLLNKYNLETPIDKNSFFNVSDSLNRLEIIPLASNLTRFVSNFLMPYSNKLVAEDKNNIREYLEAGTNQDLVAKGYEELIYYFEKVINDRYFDYQALESLKYELDGSKVAPFKAEYLSDKHAFAAVFMGYLPNNEGGYTKIDDLECPFMFGSSSEITYLEEVKEEVDKTFSYRFIPSLFTNELNPVTLTASQGLAINAKNDELHKAWSVEFLNYFFDHARDFASYEGTLPNVSDLEDIIERNLHIPRKSIYTYDHFPENPSLYQNILSNFFLLFSKDSTSEHSRLEVIDSFPYTLEELNQRNIVLELDENNLVKKANLNGINLNQVINYQDDEFFSDGACLYGTHSKEKLTYALRINLETNQVYILRSSSSPYSHEHYLTKLEYCLKAPNRFCYDKKTGSENASGWMYFDIEEALR